MSAISRPALPVADLDVARRFYVHVLGCRPATSSRPTLRTASGAPGTHRDDGGEGLDLELAGLPLSLRRAGQAAGPDTVGAAAAFVLGVDDWCTLSERLREHAVAVEVETGRRFSVEPGEQCLMRLEDPDGNVIELRGFARESDQLAA